MKTGTIITALLLTLAAQAATAQPSADTVLSASRKYYTGAWFDQCHSYLQDSLFMYYINRTDFQHDLCNVVRGRYVSLDSNQILLKQESPTRHVAVVGLTAMVVADPTDVGLSHNYYNSLLPNRKAECLLLYRQDGANPDAAVLIDSVRWDTAAPHPLVMPRCTTALETGDADGFMSCLGYDAYFSRPHILDGTFYIGGTSRSNRMVLTDHGGEFENLPTLYYNVMETVTWCISCGFETIFDTVAGPFGDSASISPTANARATFGPFLAILDTGSYRLTVATSDSTAGMAYGGGMFRSMTDAVVYAEASDGYRFAAWNDGNTDNPRTVEVYCDTTLTAIFATAEGICDASGDPWGVTVSPNPARTEIAVGVQHAGIYDITLLDMYGRTVAKTRTEASAALFAIGDLPAGVYHVVVATDGRSVSKTFVKQ